MARVGQFLQAAFVLLLRPAIASQALTPFASFSIYSLVPPTNSVFVCNSTCQLQQRQGLQLFFNETGGEGWTTSTNWTLEDPSNTLDSAAHCEWFGVSCCSVNNTILGNGNQCNTPGGVASITLPNNELTGMISADFVAALQQTITIIDLHGERTPTLQTPQ